MSTVVGRRSYRNTYTLLTDTRERGLIAGVSFIATDGLTSYAPVVREFFGSTCIYGQVIKTWHKDRVTRVERRPVIGTSRELDAALERSEDSVTLNTAYIERLNLTLRRSVSYLARRTPGHARCPRRLARQLELSRCHYNWIPTAVPVCVTPSVPASLANPKSRIFTAPGFVTNRLAGLMSRWTMPAPWASDSPVPTCVAMSIASASARGPRAMRSLSVSPS